MKQTYFFQFILFLALQPYFLSAQEQEEQYAPASIPGFSMWFAEHELASTLGNYQTINLLKLQTVFNNETIDFNKGSTVFLVLKPNQEPEGKAFLKLGDLIICDNLITVSNREIPVNYKKGEPSIISIQHRKNKKYGRLSTDDLLIGDSSLFSIAELIIYPSILSRVELRKVNTYLALKYSIPITHNEEKEWRDYWGCDDEFYWNKKTDFIFDKQVIGLGRSDKQLFFQSQTTTNAKDTLIVSIGDTLPVGDMPESDISDDSYIIFSKKDKKIISGLDCSNSEAHPNPLLNWKFQLRDWNSTDKEMFLRIPTPKQDNSSDSLFVFDGDELQYTPLIAINPLYSTYQINLENLNDNTHYFFINRKQLNCWMHDSTKAKNTLFSENGSESLIPSGNQTAYVLNDNQTMTVLLDSVGNPRAINLVKQNESSLDESNLEQPIVKIYPNPSERSSPTYVEIQNLEGEGNVHLNVFDVNGKSIVAKKLTHKEYIITSFTLRLPGFYTVIVRQGDKVYAFKHVVTASN